MKTSLFLLFSLFFISYTGAQQPEPSHPAETPVESAQPHPNLFPLEETKTQPLEEDHFLRSFMQMLLTLGIIVTMLLLLSWFLKKMLHTRIQQLNTSSNIKIIERRSLTPKTTIYILEIKGKEIAVAESTNGIVHLSNFEEEEEERPSFKQMMQEKPAP